MRSMTSTVGRSSSCRRGGCTPCRGRCFQGCAVRRLRVAPSVATWLRAGLVTPPRQHRVVFVVGPGLDGTAAEVEARSPRAIRTRSSSPPATPRPIGPWRSLDGAWTAHIAAHGVFRAESPLFSSLQLEDGPLTVYDLGRLRHAPLRLVLSSCESAMAAHVGADELLGMVSALVPLGTVNLLASVVPVNDAATVRSWSPSTTRSARRLRVRRCPAGRATANGG